MALYTGVVYKKNGGYKNHDVFLYEISKYKKSLKVGSCFCMKGYMRTILIFFRHVSNFGFFYLVRENVKRVIQLRVSELVKDAISTSYF